MQGHSGERLDAFDLAFQKWNDYNETLLGALFTNDTENTNYRAAARSQPLGTRRPLRFPDLPPPRWRRCAVGGQQLERRDATDALSSFLSQSGSIHARLRSRLRATLQRAEKDS